MLSEQELVHLSPEHLREPYLSSRVLRLTTLDAEKRLLKSATGFVIRSRGSLYAYTCWHVVTGIDFFSLAIPPVLPPLPCFITITGIDIAIGDKLGWDVRVHTDDRVLSIGGHRSFTFPLYDGSSPRWEQQNHCVREHAELNGLGIQVPQDADFVRLDINLPPEYEALWAIDAERHVYWSTGDLFEQMTLSGYPYGYSPNEASISPIYLRRSVASARVSPYNVLLDSGGAAGMSGGPVWSSTNKLIGLYRGLIFPDCDQRGDERRANDRHAALGIMSSTSTFLDSSMPDGVSSFSNYLSNTSV